MRRWATIGVDLGGTKVLSVLFDEDFTALKTALHPTLPDKGRGRFVQQLDRAVARLCESARRRGRSVRAVGAGCAGFVDSSRGLLVSAPNIPFIRRFPLAERLSRLTRAPAAIANDAQMGLYGEFRLGAARGYRNAIGIFVGTGIGGALVLDGKLYFGSTGHAGEIGHYLVDAMGPLSGSDRHGLLDDIVSRHAIAAQAASMAAKQWAPNLFREAGTTLLDMRADVLARAIKKGDQKIEELVRSRARVLGLVGVNLVNLLSPDIIVLGGGLVKSLGKIIVPEVARTLQQYALEPIAKDVRVVEARLGDLAVASGAARWALERMVNGKSASCPPQDRYSAATRLQHR